MSEIETIIREFNENGVVLVKNVLDDKTVAECRLALDRAMSEQNRMWGGGANYIDHGMVHNPMIYDDVFYKFLGNKRMLDCLEAALDEFCTLYAFTTSSMLPQGSNYSCRVHVDCPRVIPGYPTNVGFLLALNDFSAENGASYFLPNSHERTDTPSKEEFFANAIRLFPKAGDAILFNARTWHSGGQNKTDHTRHALTINVCRSYMKQRFDYPRMLGTDKLKEFDERLLRFLGYRARTPVNLEDYYCDPGERLYWPNQG